jgi:hypothetical protein
MMVVFVSEAPPIPRSYYEGEDSNFLVSGGSGGGNFQKIKMAIEFPKQAT